MEALVKLLEKLKVTFNMGPATLVLIIGLITTIVVLVMNVRSYRDKIDSLSKKDQAQELVIITMTNQISHLEGTVKTYDNIMKTFLDNPPAVLKSEIDLLKINMSRYHDISQPSLNTTSTPHPVLPDTLQ